MCIIRPIEIFKKKTVRYVLQMLLSNMQNISKGPEYEMLKPWLNDGLLLTSGNTRSIEIESN